MIYGITKKKGSDVTYHQYQLPEVNDIHHLEMIDSSTQFHRR